MLVIDGQQRLRTLQLFYNGVFEPTDTAFRLRGVNERFQGSSYASLSEDDKLRLDDSVIHAIIIRQETPSENLNDGASPSSAYHIFERLNTGGVLLQPQEIRSCIFHGPFVELLEELNEDENWRALFGNVSSRMRDRELILRFLSLYSSADKYKKPMKEYLNRFAEEYRRLDSSTANGFKTIFQKSVAVIIQAFGDKAFKNKSTVNAALCDSIMVGIANRLKSGDISNRVELRKRYDELISSQEFIDAISSATTDEGNVKKRLSLSTVAFEDVP